MALNASVMAEIVHGKAQTRITGYDRSGSSQWVQIMCEALIEHVVSAGVVVIPPLQVTTAGTAVSQVGATSPGTGTIT